MAYNFGRSNNRTAGERMRLDHGPFLIPCPRLSTREQEPFGLTMTGFNNIDYDRVQIRIAAMQVGLDVQVEKGGTVSIPATMVTQAQLDVKAMVDAIERVYDEFAKGRNIRGCHRPVGFLPHLWASPGIIQARIPREIRPVESQTVPAASTEAVSEDIKEWDLLQPWLPGQGVQEILPTATEENNVFDGGNFAGLDEASGQNFQLTDQIDPLCLEAINVAAKTPIETEIQHLVGEGDRQLEENAFQIDIEYFINICEENAEEIRDEDEPALGCFISELVIRTHGPVDKQHVETGLGHESNDN